MKRWKKNLCFALCICLVVLSMIGCSRGLSNTTNTPSSDQKTSVSGSQDNNNANVKSNGQNTNDKKKFKFLAAGAPDWYQCVLLGEAAKIFKDKVPDFELEIESIPDRPSYLQKLRIMAAGNELPDLFNEDAGPFFKELVGKGWIADAKQIYKEIGFDNKMLDIAYKYQAFDDGSLYLLSLSANMEYIWYHKDLFAKAGITETPKTFKEFLAVSKKLKAEGITPIAANSKSRAGLLKYAGVMSFRVAGGNSFIDSFKKGESSMGDPPGMEAAKFLAEVSQYFQPGHATASTTDARDLFVSGKAAMINQGFSFMIKSVLDENMQLKGDISYFKQPTTESSTTDPNSCVANSDIGIAIAKTSYNDTMKQYIKSLYENYSEMALKNQVIPPFKGVKIPDNYPQLFKDTLATIESIKDFVYPWDVRVDPATNEVVGAEAVNLVTGAITPEEFIKRSDEAVKKNAPQFFK